MGRPLALEQEARWERLITLILAGHGQYEAAKLLDVHPVTIERYLRSHPEAKVELMEAKLAAGEPVLAALRAMAIDDGYTDDKDGVPVPDVKHSDRVSAARAYLDWLKMHDRGVASLVVKHEHTHKVDIETIQSIAALAETVQERQALDVVSWEEEPPD